MNGAANSAFPSSFGSEAGLVASRHGGPVTLARLLAEAQPAAEHRHALARLRRKVVLPLAVVGLLVGGWCAWAPLSGAVVANGQVQTELGRKIVQHQEGGIVQALHVRPGQRVSKGQPLLVVGDLRSDAAFDILSKQRDAERVRAERARAELALAATVSWPADAAPETLARERQLFAARREALDHQLQSLQAQQGDARARIAALEAQLKAAGEAARLAREELAINLPLAESGFIQKTRLIAMQRYVADLEGRTEAARSDLAEARGQLGRLGQMAAELRGAYQQRAADELKEAVARQRELDDRLRPTQDQVERQTVRAPVDGSVMALRVSAPGTAVGPREPLLEIVPAREHLIVELRIEPHDIEQVHAGDAAEVRLSAFDFRSTPLLAARVLAVAPDAQQDPQTRQSWYSAQVEVAAEELARHPQLRLQAGMPAEVFITTPPRSLLQYLAQPLGLFARRALREP
ncbi:HlyD family type I secretion periplasmic adaptor subunit [Eleftheria terrae]|uniref:HlyD family type I secretion periplasmic adaptor subunit n=1 Tax=Eleftheria terrae TaxID=1597781 RepID=UPI00263AB3DC|nr:HlyD family type I secretion periplasmic adaptor subunit [Eleftheria terrae]WKB52229.1 HlyD family type I secretion periplasmic adaptor subunit [Eleftheria terrae]WKB53208.1 HlyD family type I secretion periplasmic adaptor subunit [Eleftheria terrae]